MDKNLTRDVQRLLDSRHQDKRRGKVLQLLAVLVVVVTISALAMPALTLSNEVVCGMEEHTHTEECWAEEWITPQPALACEAELAGMTLIHTHNDYCYDAVGNLICTIPELKFHVHGPECYQERRELICQEPQDLGHTHDASCYAYDKGGLICGLEEGGGHTHTEECYPLERMAEPQCGMEESDDVLDEAGNVVTPGHHHSEECYMQRVFQKLRYEHEETEDVLDEEGNVVTPGHRHTAECWMTEDELVVCGQKEGQGHTHSKECFEWIPRLVCLEEERPAGHVHDDSCYNIAQVLTCRDQEVTVHTHTDACYDENGTLTCGKPEIGEHQHTAACLATPEGEPELVRVLTCGKEEHTHSDTCYLPAEEEEPVYYCGKEEHIHNAECYFESGALKDTQEEHIHDLTCLIPPEETEPVPSEDPEASEDPEVTQDPDATEDPEATLDPDATEDPEATLDPDATEDPEASEEPAEPEPLGVTLEDYPYTYEGETFTVTYHISGYALLTDEEAQPGADLQGAPYAEPAVYENGGGQQELSLGDIEIPLSFGPVFQRMAAYLDSDPDSNLPPEFELDGNPDSNQPPEDGQNGNLDSNQPPAPVDGGASGSDTDPEGSAVIDSTPVPTQTPEWTLAPETIPTAAPEPEDRPAADQVDLGSVEVHVSEIFSGEEYDAIAEQMEKTLEEDTAILPLQVLEMSVSVGGRLLDLSECTVTATVQPNQEIKELVSDAGVSPVSDAESEEESGDAEFSFYVFTGESSGSASFSLEREADTAEHEIDSFTVELQSMGTKAFMGRTVTYKVNPNFLVQFYANLNIPERTATIQGDGTNSLPFIDTSGGAKPQNGLGLTNPPGVPLTYLNLKDSGEVEFTDKPTEIYKAEQREFNPKLGDELNINYLNSLRNNGHYVVKELWVLKAEKDPTSTDKDDWERFDASKKFVFTNNDQGKKTGDVDEDGSIYIVIQQEDATGQPTTVLRLVYAVANGKESHKATFYDYDFSNGPKGAKTGTKIDTTHGGINSYLPYYGANQTGNARFAFGNAGMGTDFGKDNWNGNALNGANRTSNGASADTYQGLSFGLVQGMTQDGTDVVFSNGITGPSIGVFGSKDGTGKLVFPNWNMNFKREGDTYTLSSVSMSNNTEVESGLDVFGHPGKYDGTNGNKKIWTNNFWPLDEKWKTQTNIIDPMFGGSVKPTMSNGWKTPDSDDGQNHNCFFGMTFSVKFDVTKEYVGPLEYYFYGDDDMWVFLDGQLVCDIGGVHSSVGEYVDLWDYVGGTRENHEGGSHTLTFFYTERGASGSTCWMQFTLPQISKVYNAPYYPNLAGLTIEKKVEGAKPELADAEFPFTLQLGDIVNKYNFKFRDANGTELAGKVMKDSSGSAVTEVSAGFYHFTLKDGERLEVIGLPIGAQYQVTEGTGFTAGGKDYPTSDGIKTTVESTNPEDTVRNLVAQGKITGEFVTEEDGTVKDKVEAVKITYTNVFLYELPSTGGAGAYTMAGMPLVAALFCLMYKKKSHGEGAAP